MSRFRNAQLVLSLLLCAPIPAPAEALGRLFFTPQQRAAINQLRPMQAALLPDTSPPTAPITVNGEIHHSNGKVTRWINGERQPPQSRGNAPLPVGDTLHPGSGERSSLLGTGRVQIHRHGAQ